jgi:hypothetical protein
MKNLIKYVYIIIAICFFTSCNVVSENEYNRQYWEYKTKNLELDYILRIQKAKDDLEFKEKIKQLDSLLN